MQENNRLVGKIADSVGYTTFVHVNPDTGKYTARTSVIKIEVFDGTDWFKGIELTRFLYCPLDANWTPPYA